MKYLLIIILLLNNIYSQEDTPPSVTALPVSVIPSKIFDPDGNGYMTKINFIETFKKRNMYQAEILEVFSYVDRNEDGQISPKEYETFFSMFLSDYQYQCDTDSNYLIDVSELEICLQSSRWFRKILVKNQKEKTLIGFSTPEKQKGWNDNYFANVASDIILVADRDGDGKINLAEYMFIRKATLAWYMCTSVDMALEQLKCAFGYFNPGSLVKMSDITKAFYFGLMQTDNSDGLYQPQPMQLYITRQFHFFNQVNLYNIRDQITKRELVEQVQRQRIPTSITVQDIENIFEYMNLDNIVFPNFVFLSMFLSRFKQYTMKHPSFLMSMEDFLAFLHDKVFPDIIKDAIDRSFVDIPVDLMTNKARIQSGPTVLNEPKPFKEDKQSEEQYLFTPNQLFRFKSVSKNKDIGNGREPKVIDRDLRQCKIDHKYSVCDQLCYTKLDPNMCDKKEAAKGKHSLQPAPPTLAVDCKVAPGDLIEPALKNSCFYIETFHLSEMFKYEKKQRMVTWSLVNYRAFDQITQGEYTNFIKLSYLYVQLVGKDFMQTYKRLKTQNIAQFLEKGSVDFMSGTYNQLPDVGECDVQTLKTMLDNFGKNTELSYLTFMKAFQINKIAMNVNPSQGNCSSDMEKKCGFGNGGFSWGDLQRNLEILFVPEIKGIINNNVAGKDQITKENTYNFRGIAWATLKAEAASIVHMQTDLNDEKLLNRMHRMKLVDARAEYNIYEKKEPVV